MFTKQLEQVVHAINPGARPSGTVTFPRALPHGGARRGSNESVRDWLNGCLHLLGGIDNLALEDTLALFLEVSWSDRAIRYANIQALWTSVPLRDFMLADQSPCHQYLRLDYNPDGALGPLLKEPQPHVHVEADGEPRFPIPVSASNDIVGWFIDFLYRNFFYDDWIAWAEETWDGWCQERNRENRWPRLSQAFDQSKPQVISTDIQLHQDLNDMKRCLAERRSAIFHLDNAPEHLEMLSHECAH